MTDTDKCYICSKLLEDAGEFFSKGNERSARFCSRECYDKYKKWYICESCPFHPTCLDMELDGVFTAEGKKCEIERKSEVGRK